jgi:inosine-uridine nucleoside N-ribohydrolase
MHDPLAVAAVAHPELITWRQAYVQVETGDRLRGVMVADYLTGDFAPDGQRLIRTANATVAVAVDAPAFNQLFLGKMKEL